MEFLVFQCMRTQKSEVQFPIVPDCVCKSLSETDSLWNRNNSIYSLRLVLQDTSIKDFKALKMLWNHGLNEEF